MYFIVTLLLLCAIVYSALPYGTNLENLFFDSNHDLQNFITYIAIFFLIWYIVVLVLAINGVGEILWKFSRIRKFNSSIFEERRDYDDFFEGVTILRPLKGVDPKMEECLESCFLQKYPTDKFEIIFCIADENDPSIPIVKNLQLKYPNVNSKIALGKEHYGPNPKINNLAKGYHDAKFDILWVLDSNVWVSSGCLQRAVRALIESTDNGRKTSRPVKLVHHLPLACSVESKLSSLGAKCDEMFLTTAHSKFYVSLNKVSIRPCVNGKSNFYRRSDLDYAVMKIGKGFNPSTDGKSGNTAKDASYYSSLKGHNGIKLFARYIGEDNMIAIALWDYCNGRTGMTGDVVIQPLGGINSLIDYCHRRIRWLRVRRYMVLMATLLEPSTECFLSGLFGTFAISVIFFNSLFINKIFILHVLIWLCCDRIQYTVEFDYAAADQACTSKQELPGFILNLTKHKDLKEWIPLWILRETLALPIWIAAMMGHVIEWRGSSFKINADLSAEEL
ncbi:hypothetical protein PACTADRAFT_51751 [Pachysolen tannophilus NRRL Y-2460]|uniref:Ceramide glucosyltransferase n=1 Tax=Pachysolen tannophilus NRRL Y-2460 TaxID=669874 RepID=A0A1E4TQH6_PACTA|nr:hypothetical protein PACTADRAFT_51751 [Pachysolen tannophilus NRRL Y-2460]